MPEHRRPLQIDQLLKEKPSIRTDVGSIYLDGCRSPTPLLEVRTQLLAGAGLALLPESDQHRGGMGITHEPADRRRGNRSRAGELSPLIVRQQADGRLPARNQALLTRLRVPLTPVCLHKRLGHLLALRSDIKQPFTLPLAVGKVVNVCVCNLAQCAFRVRGPNKS